MGEEHAAAKRGLAFEPAQGLRQGGEHLRREGVELGRPVYADEKQGPPPLGGYPPRDLVCL